MRRIALAAILALIPVRADSALTFYTDEAAYLAALAPLGHRIITEGFEDDLVWGSVRTTISDPNYASLIVSQGITWTSNHPENEVTTSSGAARTGSWGFYSMPHGNFGTGTDCLTPGMCGDGFIGTRLDTIYAVGGWVTGTFGGRLHVILDGDTLNAVDFNGANDLQSGHQFFGVIETNGFTEFEFREMEGTSGDAKYMWADDFTIALPVSSSVLISMFAADVEGVTVDLSWRISSDEGIAGFRLYRAEAGGAVPGSVIVGGLIDPSLERYSDTEVKPDHEYFYVLSVVRLDGSEIRSGSVTARIPAPPLTLSQNYPNPFNPGTVIRFSLDRGALVKLSIFDAAGRHVRTLIDGELAPGEYSTAWDGTGDEGAPLASGVYFCRLKAGKTALTHKMVMLR